MTLKRAERLLGGEVLLDHNPTTPDVIYAYYHDLNGSSMGFCGKTEKAALEELVNEVYRLRCEEVRRKQGYKCSRCGALAELQCHHKKFRSHGGTHSVLNLEACCASCHEAAHQKKSK